MSWPAAILPLIAYGVFAPEPAKSVLSNQQHAPRNARKCGANIFKPSVTNGPRRKANHRHLLVRIYRNVAYMPKIERGNVCPSCSPRSKRALKANHITCLTALQHTLDIMWCPAPDKETQSGEASISAVRLSGRVICGCAAAQSFEARKQPGSIIYAPSRLSAVSASKNIERLVAYSRRGGRPINQCIAPRPRSLWSSGGHVRRAIQPVSNHRSRSLLAR